MQEICTSGSEGGGTETNRSSLPLFVERPWRGEGHISPDLPYVDSSKKYARQKPHPPIEFRPALESRATTSNARTI